MVGGSLSGLSALSPHRHSPRHRPRQATPDTGHRIQDTEQNVFGNRIDVEILATRGAGRPSNIKLASLFQTSKSTVKLGKPDKSTDKVGVPKKICEKN